MIHTDPRAGIYVIVITWARGICLIYMPKPEGTGMYIRQIPSAHVISNIHHFRHSIKICPNLQVTVQLLYIVTDAECDSGMLF